MPTDMTECFSLISLNVYLNMIYNNKKISFELLFAHDCFSGLIPPLALQGVELIVLAIG